MTVDELRQVIKSLPPLPDKAPRFSWLSRRIEIRKKMLEDDPEEFLTWPVIWETMFVGNAPYIPKEHMTLYDTYQIPSHVLIDSGFGKPELYIAFTDGTEEQELTGEGVSGNLIHQAYHLKQWEDKTDKRVKDLSRIVEFGGGYGAMALICQRLDYQGIYSIEDFPEFSLLQRYYLSNVLKDIGNIQFNHSVADIDLYIALWSISEVEPDKRFIPNADSYLFAYAPKWDFYDNQAYFHSFIDAKPGYKWWNWQIEHLPNSWYLVGDRDD